MILQILKTETKLPESQIQMEKLIDMTSDLPPNETSESPIQNTTQQNQCMNQSKLEHQC